VTWLTLCIFPACSTTATISRTDGFTYEADILDSDANSLRVRDTYGREFLIPSGYVADIDHPGNLHFTFGSILLAISAMMIFGDLSDRDQSQRSEWSGLGLGFGIPMALTGLCLGIPGWIHHGHSKRKAKTFEDANPSRPIFPPAAFSPYPWPYPYPYPYPPPQ